MLFKSREVLPLLLQGTGMHLGKQSILHGRGMPRGFGKILHKKQSVISLEPFTFSYAQRCTQSNGVGPLEHVAAAFLLAGWQDWCLSCNSPDLPLGDGSAAVFAIPPNEEIPQCCVQGNAELCLENARGGCLKAKSAESFHVRSEWISAHGLECWEAGADSLKECLKARTFISCDDYCEVRKAGMLLGCGREQGRLLGPARTSAAIDLAAEIGVDPSALDWSLEPPRMDAECAAHKVLDLVGDLALWLGALPRLDIEMRNVGHAQFHALGRWLRLKISLGNGD